MVSHINPLDGKSFIAERFHEAPQHYLKVVSTNIAKPDCLMRCRLQPPAVKP
jgi:hypothetical protein